MDLTQWQILECLQCQKNLIEIDSDGEVNQQNVCEECLQKLTSQNKKILLQANYLQKQIHFLRAYMEQSTSKQQICTQTSDKNDKDQTTQDIQLAKMNKQLIQLNVEQQLIDKERLQLLKKLRQLQIQEEKGLDQIKKQQISIVKIAQCIENQKFKNRQLQDYLNQLRNTSIIAQLFQIDINNQQTQINQQTINQTNIYRIRQVLELLFLQTHYNPKIISLNKNDITKNNQQSQQAIKTQISEVINQINNIIQQIFYFVQFIKIQYQKIQVKGQAKFDLPYQIILQPQLMINKTKLEHLQRLNMTLKYILSNVKHLIGFNYSQFNEQIMKA